MNMEERHPDWHLWESILVAIATHNCICVRSTLHISLPIHLACLWRNSVTLPNTPMVLPSNDMSTGETGTSRPRLRHRKVVPRCWGTGLSDYAKSFGTRVLWSSSHTQSNILQQEVKGKTIPLQALTGPECSRRLRLPDFKTIDTWRCQGCQSYARAAFTHRKYCWYSFLLEAVSIPGP
jgi:hypothetical protein